MREISRDKKIVYNDDITDYIKYRVSMKSFETKKQFTIDFDSIEYDSNGEPYCEIEFTKFNECDASDSDRLAFAEKTIRERQSLKMIFNSCVNLSIMFYIAFYDSKDFNYILMWDYYGGIHQIIRTKEEFMLFLNKTLSDREILKKEILEFKTQFMKEGLSLDQAERKILKEFKYRKWVAN